MEPSPESSGKNKNRFKEKFRYYSVRILLALGVAALCLALASPLVLKILRPALLHYLLDNLSDARRLELYESLAARSGQFYDAVPEPKVGRLGKRGVVTRYRGAEVRINNAGMRSSSDYRAKPKGVFRIVCLGDSYVFGTGGPEEDRFCDQVGEFYRHRDLRAGGKVIETYALGLDSWTLTQEASYLSSRISAYDPDVILQLSVSNDITPLAGVNGLGMATYEFSPEARQWGSGLFSNQAARYFGERNFSALAWSLSPQSRQEWTRAFSALGRLVELQQGRGGKILLSVLDYPFSGQFFSELYTWHLHQSRLHVPFLATSFLPSFETQLPHDAHPNRLGNGYLAAHYIHALNRLGWIPVPSSDLPHLPEELTLDLNPEPDPDRLKRDREEFVSRHLRTGLDFGRLSREETRAFLGGIFPERGGEKALQGYPWASIRSGFLMSRLEGGRERQLVLEIRIPPLPELFPFRLTVMAEGMEIARLDLDKPEPSDLYRLEGDLPALDRRELAREVVLITSSYFAGIGNARMKSFRLVSAELE